MFYVKNQFSDEKLRFKVNYEHTIGNISDPTEVIDATQKLSSEQERMLKEHEKELHNFDLATGVKFDQKVAEQQVTLEQAGVGGFYMTTDRTEIKVQLILLDFIQQLEQKEKSGELGVRNQGQFRSEHRRNSSDFQYGYSSSSTGTSTVNENTSWW